MKMALGKITIFWGEVKTRGWQGKLCNPLKTRAIPERFCDRGWLYQVSSTFTVSSTLVPMHARSMLLGCIECTRCVLLQSMIPALALTVQTWLNGSRSCLGR